MTQRCSQGHENPDEATFCDECGEPLPAASAEQPEDAPTMPAGTAPAESAEAAAPEPADIAVPQPAPAADFEATQPAPAAQDEAPQAASALPAEEAETVTAAPEPVPEPAPAAAPSMPEPAAAPSAPEPEPAAALPRLMVEGTTQTFDLAGKASIVVGREDAPSNSFPDIDLTPYGAEEGGVSRLHARIAQSGDAWTIEDLESTNFTFINRKRITPKTPTPLNDGDEIRLGRVGLRFKTLA
ncbi:MAG TPA: FHA domain-containing protein [Ktedonobacterales bacterium]|jgi:hypothetical protein